MEMPFYGIERTTMELQKRGYPVNEKQVRRLRREMGLKTIYPHRHFNTSEPHPNHKKYPYLLRGVTIDHPNQVWSTDITYTAVESHRAFVIAIIDWFSRKVLAYNTVNTMDSLHCVETLETAIAKYGNPEIFNSDQGSQFTGDFFQEALESRGITVSMDGRGRCRDNARMERFWWSLKYEDLKIREYVSFSQLKMGVQRYVNFYNVRRIHTALPDCKTPDEVYFGTCNSRNKVYNRVC